LGKIAVLVTLLLLYTGYSALVYTKGTAHTTNVSEKVQQQISRGKQVYQQYNCMACHQIYGLGGYLGPDLTTAYSDKRRGEAYLRAILVSGGSRMPNFHLTPDQIDALISYLQYVDATANPVKSAYQ
jgi:nitric oxide reductase subunit C